MVLKLEGLHHDHIDGSAGILDVIEDLYRLAGKPLPFATKGEWQRYFKDPQENIVEKFGMVTGVLQSREALRLAGEAYGRRRAAEGMRYVEAKFAPQYHCAGGLTMAAAAEAMIAGLRAAESAAGIRILPVLCIGREAEPEVGVEVARIALEYDGEAAIDLVCDEAGHPPEKHLKAYAMTFGSNVRRDCHAGEWVAKEPAETYRRRLLENVRTAVGTLRCHGVGHAIPLADDPELVRRVAGEGIRIAGCPLSNLWCGQIADVRELRIDELLDAGVIYTLNPDDDLFMPSASAVAARCDDAYRFTEAQRRALAANVANGAFARDPANA
jgi:adenosine deaminase